MKGVVRATRLVLVTAVVLLCLPAGSSATTAVPPRLELDLLHVLPAHQADASRTDVEATELVAAPAEQGPKSCSTQSIQLLSDRLFRFQDTAPQAGCGYARFTLHVPNGTALLRVSFKSDREGTTTADADGTRLGFAQRLTVIPPGTSGSPAIIHYMDNLTLDAGLTPFNVEVQSPPPGDTIIEWWFQDLGHYRKETEVGWAGSNSYRASVHDPRVDLVGFAVAASPPREQERAVEGRTLLVNQTYDFSIPRSIFDTQYGNDTVAANARITVPATFEEPSVAGVTPYEGWQVGEDGNRTMRFAYHPSENGQVLVLTATVPRLLTTTAVLVPLAIGILAAAPAAGLGSVLYWRRVNAREPDAGTRRVLAAGASVAGAGALLAVAVLGTNSLIFISSWPLGTLGIGILAAAVALVLVAALAVEQERRRRARHQMAVRAELSDKMEELQNFVDGITHDMKTPLLTLQWLTDDLERGLQSAAQDPELAKTLDHVRNSVGGLEALVQDLLLLSKVQKGEMQRDLVALEAVVSPVLRDLGPSAERRDTRLELRIPDDLLVTADAQLLRRAMTNLVGNAIKYGREQGQIQVSAEQTGGALTIYVDDDGPGVPVEERSTLFDMFQRGRASERGGPDGTGLGLAIVKGVVERHGGTVAVADAPIGGARFAVRLPVDGKQ